MCMLCNSTSVAHLDSEIERHKPHNIPEQMLYLQERFREDLWRWIEHEPKTVEAWNMAFVSGKYARGNHLTREEFYHELERQASKHFWHCVTQHRIIPVVWHKQWIPEFYQDAIKINIIIDAASMKWFRRALWSKHYHYDHDRQLGLDQNHNLELMPSNVRDIARQHSPSPEVRSTFRQFYRDKVIDFFGRDLYTNEENFDQGYNIELSTILRPEHLILALDHICQKFDLAPVDHDFVRQAHAHWSGLHPFHERCLNRAM